jgi:multiple sugar transport system substrate-binding protein
MQRPWRFILGASAAVVVGLGLSDHVGVRAQPTGGTGAWTLPTRPITVGYWDGGNGTKGDLLKRLIAEYEKLHPNIKIKFETDVPSDKLSVALSTGTAPALVEVADWNMPKYLAVGALDPLPPAAWGQTGVEGVLNGYIPHLLDAMYHKGQLYGVPDQMNAWSFYLNNRLFREAGLDPAKDAPKTWADVVKLNTVLTKRQGDRIVQKGFEMRYACPDGRWVAGMFQTLVYQAGGEVLKDGKPAFNSAAGIRALEVWKSVTVAPQVTQNTCSSPNNDFGIEQDAMTFAGPNGGPVFERVNPQMKGNYTAVPLPQLRPDQPANLVYAFTWAVNAKSPADEKKVAWDLIHYLSTRPGQWWSEIAFLQPVKGWFETPAARQHPFLPVFIRDMSIGKPRARTTHYGELQTIVMRLGDRVILNNADPKQALDRAADEFARAAQ